MGHIRLKRLPASRKWQQVVSLLSAGASVEQLASASAAAAEHALLGARADPALTHAFWLLTQLPLAARAPDFRAATSSLGINVGQDASLIEIVAAYGDAVDRAAMGRSGRTDLGEMARNAAAESIATIAGAGLPRLFGATADDVRLELGKLAAPDRFARLARDFFARLTEKHLDFYLSRAVPNHIGRGQLLASTSDHISFNAALELHCHEASRIVEAFAGGWFSKTHFEGGITPENARGFVFVALNKINAELKRRENGGG